jgi:GTPase SAR1 family protein
MDVPEIRSQIKNFVTVIEVRENKLVYSTYKFAGTNEVDLSDLIVFPGIIGKGDPFNATYPEMVDFKYLLLKNGYAKLKKPSAAPSYCVSAENDAQEKRLGIWRQSEQQSSIQQQSSKKPFLSTINWKKLINILWKLIVVLSTLGITTAIARHLYKKIYIQRRIRLLIIGEPFSGKTALLMSLVNSSIEKEEIFKLTGQSSGVTEKERQGFIPRGKFEIYPSISDIPGHFYGTVWDKFFKEYNHAIIIVISAFKENGRNSDGSIRLLDSYKDIDQKYIHIQLGSMKAYIGGVASKFTKKPKILILYISKFDLFSEFPPEDSSSQKTKQVLEELFSEHIEFAAKTAKDIGIPFKLIFGSAIEKWNTDKMLDVVINQLYGI